MLTTTSEICRTERTGDVGGPAISVLMPAYNVEAYVEEAIASLQNQTISNIEVVVVNDCSSDGTLNLLERIAHGDPRIRVFSTPRNGGIVAAMNFGLTFCRASYIARMDGDDIAVPDRLEKQLAFLQSHSDIALVSSMVSPVDVDGNAISLVGPCSVPVSQESIQGSLLLGPPCFHMWLARRELYYALSGYRSLAPAEDYDFLLRAITSGYKVGNIPEVLTKLRIRPGNSADLAGLRQRKTHHYVIKLYRERVAHGTDSFSPSSAKRAVRMSKVAIVLHRAALRCVNRTFASRYGVLKLLLLTTAAVISPWQARYFLDRLRLRFILRKA